VNCLGMPPGFDPVRELEVQRLRTAVAVEVSPRLWEYFDEVGPIAAVVEDIVDRWTTSAGRQALTGSDGFTTAYLSAVERDAAGQPWWQVCRLDAGRRPMADESYPKRVWTHHAGWLRRLFPAGGATTVPDPLPEGAAGELVVERLRTEATVEVVAAVHDWLGQDPARIGAVVADVVARWLALPADERAKVELTGQEQFTQRYVAKVLYADPVEDEYWPEFCPPADGESFDWDTYARAVWTDHVDQLAGVR
jgi:hypothetical protein